MTSYTLIRVRSEKRFPESEFLRSAHGEIVTAVNNRVNLEAHSIHGVRQFVRSMNEASNESEVPYIVGERHRRNGKEKYLSPTSVLRRLVIAIAKEMNPDADKNAHRHECVAMQNLSIDGNEGTLVRFNHNYPRKDKSFESSWIFFPVDPEKKMIVVDFDEIESDELTARLRADKSMALDVFYAQRSMHTCWKDTAQLNLYVIHRAYESFARLLRRAPLRKEFRELRNAYDPENAYKRTLCQMVLACIG